MFAWARNLELATAVLETFLEFAESNSELFQEFEHYIRVKRGHETERRSFSDQHNRPLSVSNTNFTEYEQSFFELSTFDGGTLHTTRGRGNMNMTYFNSNQAKTVNGSMRLSALKRRWKVSRHPLQQNIEDYQYSTSDESIDSDPDFTCSDVSELSSYSDSSESSSSSSDSSDSSSSYSDSSDGSNSSVTSEKLEAMKDFIKRWS
ncbi:hypothetical protein RF11_09498 [Thelohanellus kitauei]|uniref:Uncharacterized protein n=1 Tax=Thelohanellus kitauei TaxID=669202 RepID=A0A0C2JG94_THEKT|nr:hypothetical protein RF11_09498 [Thelohanellus kitauei]